MSKKILNLYAGIGGNRELWDEVMDVSVTAVEIEKEIADIYQDRFPEDEVVVGHAQTYLRRHYKDFDFIWSSPPCPSHSHVRLMASKSEGKGSYEPVFPNLSLYEEILFLKHYFDGKWVVENVDPFYEPMVNPTVKIHRHLLWSNFTIPEVEIDDNMSHNERGYIKESWVDLSKYDLTHRKDKIIRNCVNPKIGEYILESAFKNKQTNLLDIQKSEVEA